MSSKSSKKPTSSASFASAPAYQGFRQQFGALLRDLGASSAGLAAGSTDAKPWPALIVLHGDSDFFLAKSLQALREVWQRRFQTADSTEPAVINSVDAAELAKDGLLDLVLSQSLFEETQLVVVRRAEKKSDAGKLMSALPLPHQDSDQKEANFSRGWSNRLIMMFEKAALPVEVQRQVARLGGQVIHVTQPLSQADFMQYIQTTSQRARLQLTAEAQQLIFNCCGRDVVIIENEINRLGLLFPPVGGKPADLGTSEVSSVLGALREDEVFRLDELLVNRRHAEVELLLHSLMARGESVLAVVGILARHCRNGLAIQDEMVRRGALDVSGMAAKLRLPQAVIRNFVRYVPGVPRTTFERALAACAQADVELKTSGLPDGLALSRIVECFQNI